MKRQVYAEIYFGLPAGRRPTSGFVAHAKLPSDADGHPYGQWSVAVQPIAEHDAPNVPACIPAFIAFVSEDAPHGELLVDSEFQLYYGPRCIGSVRLAGREAETLPSDDGFLLLEDEAA